MGSDWSWSRQGPARLCCLQRRSANGNAKRSGTSQVDACSCSWRRMTSGATSVLRGPRCRVRGGAETRGVRHGGGLHGPVWQPVGPRRIELLLNQRRSRHRGTLLPGRLPSQGAEPSSSYTAGRLVVAPGAESDRRTRPFIPTPFLRRACVPRRPSTRTSETSKRLVVRWNLAYVTSSG